MPALIEVPNKYKNSWQFKIYDNEEMEPSHVTIRGPGGDVWRWALREKKFIQDPPPTYERDVPKDLVKELKKKWVENSRKWNNLPPHSPVKI